MINKTNKNNYLNHAEIIATQEFRSNIKNPELLAFIEESNSHYKKSWQIKLAITVCVTLLLSFLFNWQNSQHLKDVSQLLEITKTEKQKVISAQIQTEKALVESNHNYAQALNQKALTAKEDSNFENAKLYALTALKNSNNNADLVESLNIISKYGTDSSHALKHSINIKGGRYNKIATSKSYIATTASHNDLQVWNLETQDTLRLTGHTSNIINIKFSPSDPTLLLSVSSDGELRLWNLKNKSFQLLPTVNSSSTIAIDFSQNGKVLATSSDNGMQIIDMHSFEVTHKFTNSFLFPSRRFNKLSMHSHVENLSLNSDGSKVAYASRGSSDILNILDIAENYIVVSDKKQVKQASNVLFSKDGNELIFGDGKDLVIWSIATNRYKRFKGNNEQIKQVLMHPQLEKIITYHENDELRSWTYDGNSSLVVKRIQGSLTFNYNGDKIYSTDNNKIKIHDYFTGDHTNKFMLTKGWITSLALSPDDRFLAFGTSHGDINIADLVTGNISTFNNTKLRVKNLHFSQNGKHIVGFLQGNRRIAIVEWGVTDREQRVIAEYSGEFGSYGLNQKDSTFSHDGRFFAFKQRNIINILDIKTGEKQNIIVENFNDLAINNDGSLLISTSKGLKLWDWTSRGYKALAQKSIITGKIAFTPTGSNYAGVVGKRNSHVIELWALEGAKLAHLKINENKIYRIRDFRFSVDSKEIYVLGCDKFCSITKWDLAGNKLGEIPAQPNAHILTIASDNAFLVSASLDDISVHEKNEAINFSVEWHKPNESLVSSLLDTLSFDNINLNTHYFGKGSVIEKVEKYKENIVKKINIWSSIASPWRNESFNTNYVVTPYITMSSIWDMQANQLAYKLDPKPQKKAKKIVEFNTKEHLIHFRFAGNNKYKYEVFKGCVLKVINTSTGIERAYENVCSPVYFSEDSQYLIFSVLKRNQVEPSRIDSEKLKILKLDTSKIINVESKINNASIHDKPIFSPDGKYMFIRLRDEVALIDLELGEIKLMTHYQRAISERLGNRELSFSSNSDLFVYLGGSQGVIFDLKNNKKQIGRYKGYIRRLLIHPSNELVVILTSREIRIHSIKGFFTTPPIVLATTATDIYFSPDGKLLLNENRTPILKEKGISFVNFEPFLKTKTGWEELLNKYSEKAGIKVVGMDIENTGKPIFKLSPKLKLNWSKHHPFYWQEQAEKGEPEALLQLGIIAQRDKKWDKAKEWYQKAKAAGHNNAEYRLNINELMRKEYSQ